MDEWFEELSLPGLAMMLIIAGETTDKDEVWLPNNDAARWYGLSLRSVDSGIKNLADHGLLDERVEWIKAPLSATGTTKRHWYQLTGDFTVPRGRNCRPMPGRSSRPAPSQRLLRRHHARRRLPQPAWCASPPPNLKTPSGERKSDDVGDVAHEVGRTVRAAIGPDRTTGHHHRVRNGLRRGDPDHELTTSGSLSGSRAWCESHSDCLAGSHTLGGLCMQFTPFRSASSSDRSSDTGPGTSRPVSFLTGLTMG